MKLRRAMSLSAVACLVAVFAVSTPAYAVDPLVSQGKTATASSQESSSLAPQYAVDGVSNSRWASDETNSEWIQIDLGRRHQVSRVVLDWESAYGSGYKIQMSDNGSTWWDAYTTTTGNGGTDDLAVDESGRYIRMLGTQRATIYGYSLWEFKVYGTEAPIGGTGGSWYPLFNDEFSGSSLNTSVWQPNWFGANDTVTTTGINNNETQCYAPSQVTVSGGTLNLALISSSTSCGGVTQPYKSGLVHTSGRASWGMTDCSNACYFEARIKLPTTTNTTPNEINNWPAFWTAGEQVDWPTGGEIDIMEAGPDMWGAYHWDPTGPDDSRFDVMKPTAPNTFLDGGWHTYGAQWSSDGKLRYYWDGNALTIENSSPAVYELSNTETSAEMFAILNLATCPTYCGPQVAGTMQVDYFRVWGR